MKTFFLDDSNNYTGPAVSALVLGNFDGIHHGHNELLKKAKESGENWALMTFEPHPKEFFNQENFLRIYSPTDTISSFEFLNVPVCLTYSFNEKLAYKSAEEFLNEVILKVNPTSIVVGEDFMFGKDRSGSVKNIEAWALENNISVHVVKLKKHNNEEKISSSLIRALLFNGEIEVVNTYLLNPFFISGLAVREKGLATQLGFPTINVRLEENSNLKFGVYCSKIFIQGVSYNSITNFGIRPTVDNLGSNISMETHVLNFPERLNGVELGKVRVEFLKFIRPESRFESIDLLKAQVQKDLLVTKQFFLTK